QADAALNYISGSRSIVQRRVTHMSVSDRTYDLRAFYNLPSLGTDGWDCYRYKLTGHVAFQGRFTAAPDVWIRESGSTTVRLVNNETSGDAYHYEGEYYWA